MFCNNFKGEAFPKMSIFGDPAIENSCIFGKIFLMFSEKAYFANASKAVCISSYDLRLGHGVEHNERGAGAGLTKARSVWAIIWA